MGGNLVCFPEGERRLVGHRLGREDWGQGIATEALSQFLRIVAFGPLLAFAATENRASIRVLQKGGFLMTGNGPGAPRSIKDEAAEVVLFQDAHAAVPRYSPVRHGAAGGRSADGRTPLWPSSAR